MASVSSAPGVLVEERHATGYPDLLRSLYLRDEEGGELSRVMAGPGMSWTMPVPRGLARAPDFGCLAGSARAYVWILDEDEVAHCRVAA